MQLRFHLTTKNDPLLRNRDQWKEVPINAYMYGVHVYDTPTNTVVVRKFDRTNSSRYAVTQLRALLFPLGNDFAELPRATPDNIVGADGVLVAPPAAVDAPADEEERVDEPAPAPVPAIPGMIVVGARNFAEGADALAREMANGAGANAVVEDDEDDIQARPIRQWRGRAIAGRPNDEGMAAGLEYYQIMAVSTALSREHLNMYVSPELHDHVIVWLVNPYTNKCAVVDLRGHVPASAVPVCRRLDDRTRVPRHPSNHVVLRLPNDSLIVWSPARTYRYSAHTWDDLYLINDHIYAYLRPDQLSGRPCGLYDLSSRKPKPEMNWYASSICAETHVAHRRGLSAPEHKEWHCSYMKK